MSFDIKNYSFSDSDNDEYIPKIEYPTIHSSKSEICIYKQEFPSNKLFISTNEQFEIIPKIIIPRKVHEKKTIRKILNKKRGRQTSKKLRKRKHDRKCPCNIRTKITIAYLSFLRQFTNSAIEYFLREDKDVNKYKLKKIFSSRINLNYIKELKQKTIKEIMQGKENENEENKIICNIIAQKNKNLEIILNQKYMKFFKDIFYQSKTKVNLENYKINDSFFLNSEVVLYNDFINKIKNEGGDDLEEYLLKIEEIIKNY